MARELQSLQSQRMINISQSHLSSPRDIPESQTVFAAADAHTVRHTLTTGPASPTQLLPARKNSGEEIPGTIPESLADAHSQLRIHTTQGQRALSDSPQQSAPSDVAATSNTTAKRTPSNLQTVAQQALARGVSAQREIQPRSTAQSAARSSSNTSTQSQTSTKAPSATSQTGLLQTSVVREPSEPGAIAGMRAADLLRARRGHAEDTPKGPSLQANEEDFQPFEPANRVAGRSVLTSKAAISGKPRATKTEVVASGLSKENESVKSYSATSAFIPEHSAPKSRDMTRLAISATTEPLSKVASRKSMPVQTPTVTSSGADTGQASELHDGHGASGKVILESEPQGGRKRSNVGTRTMNAKHANGPFHFRDEGDAGSNYDISVSSPRSRAQAKSIVPESRRKLRDRAQPGASVVQNAVVTTGKLPKVSSYQVRAELRAKNAAAQPSSPKVKALQQSGSSSELEPASSSQLESSTQEKFGAKRESRGQVKRPVSPAPNDAVVRDQSLSPVVLGSWSAPATKAHGSGQDPLVISDDAESSSVFPEPDPSRTTIARARKTKPPKTPVKFRSSPPMRSQHVSEAAAGSRRPAARSHKTTIVAFGRSGPRNQGMLPTNTPGARSMRSSAPPSRARPEHGRTPGDARAASEQRSKGLSSRGTSVYTCRVMPPLKQSNTAATVDDALENLFDKLVKSACQSDTHLAPVKLDGKVRANDGGQQTDENEFVNIDDLEEPSAPLPKPQQRRQRKRDQQSEREPTQEELICNPPASGVEDNEHSCHAPPELNPAQDDRDEADHANHTHLRRCVDAKAERNEVVESSVAQKHEPNLADKPSQKPSSAAEHYQSSNREHQMGVLDNELDGDTIVAPDAAVEFVERQGKAKASPRPPLLYPRRQQSHKDDSAAAPGKTRKPIAGTESQADDAGPATDSLESSSTAMPPPARTNKRASVASTAKGILAVQVKKTAASSRSKLGLPLNPAAEQPPKRVKASDVIEEVDAAQENQISKVHQKRALSHNDFVTEPYAKRAMRNSTRQASQGSQTVDLHGSPVPRDMEVAEKKTVLETFSHQAAIFSNHAPSTPNLRRTITPYRGNLGVLEEGTFSAPPSHERRVLSSNTKSISAEPDAESTAISRVKVTEKESKLLYGKVKPVVDIKNPFNDSIEQSRNSNQSQNESPTRATEPIECLDAVMRPPISHETKRKITKSHFPEKMAPSKLQSRRPTQTSSPAPTRPQAGVRKKARQASSSPYATKMRRSVEKLVGYTAPARRMLEDPDMTLVNDDESALETNLAKSPHHAAVDPESQPDLQDLVSWSGLLKPHQRSLFDELVKCAQHLTIDIVSEEKATYQILEDYHRRNMYLIQQEEKSQVKHYQDLFAIRRQKSKGRNACLLKVRTNVEGLSKDYKHDLQKHEAKRAAWGVYNQELAEYLDGLQQTGTWNDEEA